MKVFYQTFGCKVNQYEIQNITELMTADGHTETSDFKNADIAIINTCTVTSSADSKCRQAIRRIRSANCGCIICAVGCLTQAAASDDILPECDIIAGSRNKTAIPSLIRQFLSTGERIVAIEPLDREHGIELMHNSTVAGKTRAYIKIQDGCEMYCTYCIIPYARGKLSSKPVNDIIKEAEALIASGHKEIILTGINLCCYGRDLKDGTRLIHAIKAVCGIEGDFRVRLSSVEPEMITDKDISEMAALEKLCPHFHLSLQSGCDKTLKAMKRHYTSDEYFTLVQKLRESFKNAAITTDIMVGFPGESDDDHRQSLEFAERIGFADAHIFPYSRRAGTPADKMEGQTDGGTKHRRCAEMTEVISRSRKTFLESMVGNTVRVLFEKEREARFHQGHSDNYVLIKVKRENADITLRRQMKDVKITHCDDNCCYGELI